MPERRRPAPAGRAAVLVALAAACRMGDVAGPDAAMRLRVAAGDGQRVGAGGSSAQAVVVRAEQSADGSPVSGVRIRFSILAPNAGGARVEDPVVVTDDLGNASTRIVAGAPDTIFVEATVAAGTAAARARATLIVVPAPRLSSVRPSEARPGDTLRLAGSGLGGARVVVRLGGMPVAAIPVPADDSVRAVVPPCAPIGATQVAVDVDGSTSNAMAMTVRDARVLALRAPYEFITVPATRMSACVALPGDGSYLVTGQFASVPAGAFGPAEWLLGVNAAPGPARAVDAGPGPGAQRATAARARGSIARDFDRHRRALEQVVAASIPAAERASARLSDATPAVGSLRTFRVVAATDGSRFVNVTARLEHAGSRVLTYADTAARFTVGQLLAFSRLLDHDLVGAAVAAFGAAPDMDGNGRVIVLLTPVVNAMVRAQDCIFSGYVTGFFYPTDEHVRLPNSNRGEVFYGFVPDSTGQYSCPHTEAEVVRTLQATFLHEMQHLISFNAKVLAQGGGIEDTWLNEGLSQIAEELGSRLFEARYPAPSGRSTLEQLFPDSAAPFIAPQMLNAYVYLTRPMAHSVTAYERTGSLEERGATWLFLRWLLDQHGDGAMRRMVQSTRRGAASVEAATGESLAALFGDFALALFADSLPGLPRAVVPERLRYRSRNVRRLMAREATISGFQNPFPLTTYLLAPGTALRGTMLPGTMMHAIIPGTPGGGPLRLTFAAPSGAPFAPDLGAQVSVLRLPP